MAAAATTTFTAKVRVVKQMCGPPRSMQKHSVFPEATQAVLRVLRKKTNMEI